ncbi:uncharacterized protein LOC100182892 [Ciona intestinalis]
MVAKMAVEAESRINLAALKRKDPYISNIIDSATQVAVYTFSPLTNEWEKTEVEGTLFVYSRVAQPMFGFTIMNRLSMDNLTEVISSNLEFQNKSPFLLYRNAKLVIYGIWFYDMYDCTRIETLLSNLCKREREGNTPNINVPISSNNDHSPVLPSPNSTGDSSASSLSDVVAEYEVMSNQDSAEELTQSQTQNGDKSVDIMGLLFKAKDDYDKRKVSEAIPKASNKASFQPVPVKSSTKFNISTLFNQRPSSAELFAQSPENNSHQQSNEPKKRFAARSLSLSLGNGQSLFETNQPINLVNGAISVEELESPVLGMPAHRARFYSTSDAAPRNLSQVEESVIDKLFDARQVGVQTNHFQTTTAGKTSAVQTIPATKTHTDNHPKPPFTMGGPHPHNASLNTTSLAQSFPSLYSQPTTQHLSLHSNFRPPVPPTSISGKLPQTSGPALTKSMSVASGLAMLPLTTTSPLRVVPALHGTTKDQPLLLSPHALRPSAKGSKCVPIPHTKQSASALQNQQKVSEEPKKDTLISPQDFEHSTFMPEKAEKLRQRLVESAGSPQVEAMDKEQFAKTLVFLLQSDDSFLSTVHNAYVSSLHASKQGNPSPNSLWN